MHIVEPDTAQFGTKKKKNKKKGERRFCGRALVLASRLTSSWSITTLPDKQSSGKRGSGGPECTSEVLPFIEKPMKENTLISPEVSHFGRG